MSNPNSLWSDDCRLLHHSPTSRQIWRRRVVVDAIVYICPAKGDKLSLGCSVPTAHTAKCLSIFLSLARPHHFNTMMRPTSAAPLSTTETKRERQATYLLTKIEDWGQVHHRQRHPPLSFPSERIPSLSFQCASRWQRHYTAI